MHSQPFRLTAGFLALTLTGCATTGARFPVQGRMVEVKTLRGDTREQTKGELLAVDPDFVLILGPHGPSRVSRAEIERVRVKLHGLDGRKATAWVVLGAVITGVALAAACASVEDADNCGAAFALTGLGWGLIGAPSAASLAKSSRVIIDRSSLDALRPYARFPQGLPEGLDPAALAASAGDKSPR